MSAEDSGRFCFVVWVTLNAAFVCADWILFGAVSHFVGVCCCKICQLLLFHEIKLSFLLTFGIVIVSIR